MVVLVVTVPAAVTLAVRAVRELAGKATVGRIDGAAALAGLASAWMPWMWVWWRRHGGQFASFLRSIQLRAREGK